MAAIDFDFSLLPTAIPGRVHRLVRPSLVLGRTRLPELPPSFHALGLAGCSGKFSNCVGIQRRRWQPGQRAGGGLISVPNGIPVLHCGHTYTGPFPLDSPAAADGFAAFTQNPVSRGSNRSKQPQCGHGASPNGCDGSITTALRQTGQQLGSPSGVRDDINLPPLNPLPTLYSSRTTFYRRGRPATSQDTAPDRQGNPVSRHLGGIGWRAAAAAGR
jgi:hypothetical protein